jgi:hypothetical protein
MYPNEELANKFPGLPHPTEKIEKLVCLFCFSRGSDKKQSMLLFMIRQKKKGKE